MQSITFAFHNSIYVFGVFDAISMAFISGSQKPNIKKNMDMNFELLYSFKEEMVHHFIQKFNQFLVLLSSSQCLQNFCVSLRIVPSSQVPIKNWQKYKCFGIWKSEKSIWTNWVEELRVGYRWVFKTNKLLKYQEIKWNVCS